MDSSSKEVKTKKVGEDGLSKKERRALKVQARNPEQKNPANESVEKDIQGDQKDKKNEIPPKPELSEKELRKLEWEKKLATQKSKIPENISKSELKAKRREQQEAQRLAKTVSEQKPKPDVKKPQKIEQKKPVSKKTENRVQLVQHLYTETRENKFVGNPKDVHPAFVRLGVQHSAKIILGSNARCLSLLSAVHRLIDDLQTPPKREFCRHFESVLQSCVTYLHGCRPLAVAMFNALRHIKLQLTQVDTNLSDNAKKACLRDVIDTYINDDIKKAGEAISLKVNEKITTGDVILIYGCSSLIRKILIEAHKDGKKFEVIVIDGRPLLEGREMLRRLVKEGIKCTYVLINAVSYIMGSVTKVLLGAHALLTNGYVMSRIGTAQIAMVAQGNNKPVLVCCETYKFSERVQTDAFVYNEIGDPEQLVTVDITDETSPLNVWKENSKLTPLSLLYDVTPPDFVTAVVTELAVLPCSSVPVVLRINAKETVKF